MPRSKASRRPPLHNALVPSIAAYEMPGVSYTQENRVAWTLQPTRAALLVHDMQNYWVNRFENPKVLLANCEALLNAARAVGMSIIYSVARREARPEDRGLAYDMWGEGMGGDSSDPTDEDVVPLLCPQNGDLVVEKHKYSAFFRTGLEDVLREKGIDQLLVAGVYAHHGCLLSAADAYMRDVKPFFIIDAVADHSEEQHLMTCRIVPSLCGQNVLTQQMISTMRG